MGNFLTFSLVLHSNENEKKNLISVRTKCFSVWICVSAGSGPKHSFNFIHKTKSNADAIYEKLAREQAANEQYEIWIYAWTMKQKKGRKKIFKTESRSLKTKQQITDLKKKKKNTRRRGKWRNERIKRVWKKRRRKNPDQMGAFIIIMLIPRLDCMLLGILSFSFFFIFFCECFISFNWGISMLW